MDLIGGVQSGATTFANYAEGDLVWTNGLVDIRLTYQGDIDSTLNTVAISGGNDVVLYTSPVPEPALMGVFGAISALMLRRRHR